MRRAETADHDRTIRALLSGASTPQEAAAVIGADVDALPAFARYLKRDLSIGSLERVEAALKSVLLTTCARAVDGDTARKIAAFQQSVGFLLKYKPYAVKCANPLGYSVFLQNQGQGFSFQRHVTHKTEIFHILDAPPGAYVFLCDFADWEAVYEPAAFKRWLTGYADDRYDQFCYRPQPGDVFVVHELNIVHTIVGCVVEEFATISTDMVDRLYDQNAETEIPSYFVRQYAHDKLGRIDYPAQSRLVEGFVDPRTVTPIPATCIQGGSVRVLGDDFVRACHYRIDAHETGPRQCDASRATAINVTSGHGRIVVTDEREAAADAAVSLAVSAGDVLTIAPSALYQPISDGPSALEFSEHRIALEVAMSPLVEHSSE